MLDFVQVEDARIVFSNGHTRSEAIYRAKVPGGWLVRTSATGDGIAFLPDPEHRWDGASLR